MRKCAFFLLFFYASRALALTGQITVLEAPLFLKPDEKSKILEKIKNGQEMLFISEPDQNWSYVSVKIDESCIEGFVIAKNIIAKDDQDKSISVGSSSVSYTHLTLPTTPYV